MQKKTTGLPLNQQVIAYSFEKINYISSLIKISKSLTHLDEIINYISHFKAFKYSLVYRSANYILIF